MTAAAIIGILVLVSAVLVGYLRSKNATIDSKEDKIQALEKAAEKDRKAEEAEDEAVAEEIIRTDNRTGAIDFLRRKLGEAGR